MRDSFIFYRNFFECIEKLPLSSQLSAYRAISAYALNGEETELVGMAQIIYEMAKPNIDSNNKRYRNGCKGGRPTDEDSPRKVIEGIELVNLTETQFDRLVIKFGEDLILRAIQKLENWLETGVSGISKPAKNAIGKNHYCYFKKDKWIIIEAKKDIEKEKEERRPNYGI